MNINELAAQEYEEPQLLLRKVILQIGVATRNPFNDSLIVPLDLNHNLEIRTEALPDDKVQRCLTLIVRDLNHNEVKRLAGRFRRPLTEENISSILLNHIAILLRAIQ
jgi:hypothetical protein